MPPSVNFTSQKQYLRFVAVRRIIRKRIHCIQIFPNDFTAKVYLEWLIIFELLVAHENVFRS